MEILIRKSTAGFTLIEFVMLLVIVSVLSVYAVVNWPDDSDIKLPVQAELMTGHIHHAQTLATLWGQSLRLSISSGGYSVSCVTASATPPCNASPVIDPVSGAPFSVTLESGITLSGSVTTDFDSLGRPVSAGAIISSAPARVFTLSAGAASRSITLSPLTGYMVIS